MAMVVLTTKEMMVEIVFDSEKHNVIPSISNRDDDNTMMIIDVLS